MWGGRLLDDEGKVDRECSISRILVLLRIMFYRFPSLHVDLDGMRILAVE